MEIFNLLVFISLLSDVTQLFPFHKFINQTHRQVFPRKTLLWHNFLQSFPLLPKNIIHRKKKKPLNTRFFVTLTHQPRSYDWTSLTQLSCYSGLYHLFVLIHPFPRQTGSYSFLPSFPHSSVLSWPGSPLSLSFVNIHARIVLLHLVLPHIPLATDQSIVSKVQIIPFQPTTDDDPIPSAIDIEIPTNLS